MKVIRYIVLFFSVLIFSTSYSQEEILPDGFTVFYHANDEKSSEGIIKDGKPEGYWKTYNEEGILISEGNRKNHLLDSTWKFYDDSGLLKMDISYEEGKKNGIRTTYRENERIEENFIDDLKQGITSYYYPEGELKKTVIYVNGLEEGIAKEYAEDGRITQLITYKKGFISNRERINRFDNEGKKHGNWKYYYKNGTLQLECIYKHGLRNGYYKEYDIEGNLLHAYKFVDGEKQEFVAELTKLDVKTEYYPNGKVKVKATYKDDKPEGVWREYSEDGEIEKSYIFKYGIIIGEGIITEQGEKTGPWKEYFDNGVLKGKGNYDKDVRVGPWTYYHRNGEIEQTGIYDSLGRNEGVWNWYYASGILHREESFKQGLAEGEMTEYNELGNILTTGTFWRGTEDGEWFYELGDHREEGEYIEGMREGEWKSYYANGDLKFKGKFIEDNPHGEHVWYWDNGKLRDKGSYIMGRKHGDWITYNHDGSTFLVITFENGIEKKYDGVRVNPENTIENDE